MEVRVFLLCFWMYLTLHSVSCQDPLPLWRKLSLQVKKNIAVQVSPDENNDGYVSDAEAAKYLGLEGEDLDEFLVSSDDDSNGLIEPNEFFSYTNLLSGQSFVCNEGRKACDDKLEKIRREREL